jgi:SAM-dependent methyltransferase
MTTDRLPMIPGSTIRSDEVARFNRLAATWWNRAGPMRPLHVVNELRLGYVLEQIARRFARPVGALQGLRIADIGCGAGLMCEPLAARGARVVGVDAAANNIAVAPGMTDTPMTAGMLKIPAMREGAARQYPLGGVQTAKQVADVMAWLLGDGAQRVTGQVIAVDGGFSTVRPLVK